MFHTLLYVWPVFAMSDARTIHCYAIHRSVNNIRNLNSCIYETCGVCVYDTRNRVM